MSIHSGYEGSSVNESTPNRRLRKILVATAAGGAVLAAAFGVYELGTSQTEAVSDVEACLDDKTDGQANIDDLLGRPASRYDQPITEEPFYAEYQACLDEVDK